MAKKSGDDPINSWRRKKEGLMESQMFKRKMALSSRMTSRRLNTC